MDRAFVFRLFAGVVGVAAAALGAFAVFIGGAVQALDSAPRIPEWLSVVIPLIALASALIAAGAGARRAKLATALYALAGVIIGASLVALALRPILYAVPVALLAAAALAWFAPPRITPR